MAQYNQLSSILLPQCSVTTLLVQIPSPPSALVRKLKLMTDHHHSEWHIAEVVTHCGLYHHIYFPQQTEWFEPCLANESVLCQRCGWSHSIQVLQVATQPEPVVYYSKRHVLIFFQLLHTACPFLCIPLPHLGEWAIALHVRVLVPVWTVLHYVQILFWQS